MWPQVYGLAVSSAAGLLLSLGPLASLCVHVPLLGLFWGDLILASVISGFSVFFFFARGALSFVFQF